MGGSCRNDFVRRARDRQQHCRFALNWACILTDDDNGESALERFQSDPPLHSEGILYQQKTWVSILRVIRDKLMASRDKVALSRVPEGPLVTQKQAV